jgi:RHS repeat-associated protein
VELTPTGGQLEVIYDPEGQRVGWYSAYSPGNGQWVFGLVPFMGWEIAEYSWTNSFAFNHPNGLGSASFSSDDTGSLLEDIVYYPWGQIFHEFGPYYDSHFAELDASQQGSNWADFSMFEAPYRFYAPNPGRWHSPDPLGGDITNPQSLNRYPYAGNNPMTQTDPTGLLNGILYPTSWEREMMGGGGESGLSYLNLNAVAFFDSLTPLGGVGTNILNWSQLSNLVQLNNLSLQCDELVDCIIFKESG